MSYLSFSFRKISFRIRYFSSNDHIYSVSKYVNGFYEIDLLEYLRRMSICGEIAIDVGANVGNHSIYFASFLADQVICVEPNRKILPILEENLRINPGKYAIIRKAAGEIIGFGETITHDENNIGATIVNPGSGEVPITTLDIISPKRGVFLVKIDVEGMEIDVLRGASQLLSSQRPHIVVEAATATNYTELEIFLSKYGYQSISQWASTPTYHFAYQPNTYLLAKARLLVFVGRVWRRLIVLSK